MNYNWPGNIRELENVIERAIILTKGPTITPDDFPESLNKNNELSGGSSDLSLKDALRSPEKGLIVKALDSVGWNRNEAAKVLGINRTTLYKKMHRFGLLKNEKCYAKKV